MVTKIMPVRASHSNPVNNIGYPIAIHQGIKEGLKAVSTKPPKIVLLYLYFMPLISVLIFSPLDDRVSTAFASLIKDNAIIMRAMPPIRYIQDSN